MLRRKMTLLASLTLVVFLSGCAAYSVSPLTGFLYTDVQGPADATSNEGSSKMGIAKAQSILGLVATGDASIEAAMKDGGITKIHHVDYHSKGVLGIWAEFTVIVYGE